jgi:hypothetical protein
VGIIALGVQVDSSLTNPLKHDLFTRTSGCTNERRSKVTIIMTSSSQEIQ